MKYYKYEYYKGEVVNCGGKGGNGGDGGDGGSPGGFSLHSFYIEIELEDLHPVSIGGEGGKRGADGSSSIYDKHFRATR